MRIILRISCTYTTCKICRFGEISEFQKKQKFLQIRNKNKCHFGDVLEPYVLTMKKVAFGSSKSKNVSKLTHFDTFFIWKQS
jgi:hypothetical protein